MRTILDFLFKNQMSRQIVLKNAVWQLFGQIGSRFVRAALVIYAARVLGAEGYGLISYTLGFAAFFTFFSDLGLDQIVTREAAREQSNKAKILGSALYIKLVLTLLTYAIILIAGMTIMPIKEAKLLVPFIGLTLALEAIRGFGFAVVRAQEKMEVEAGTHVFWQIATVSIGFSALAYWKTPLALSVAYTIGGIIGLIPIAYYLRSYVAEIALHFDSQHAKRLLKDGWPFVFLGLMGTMLTTTDTVMLGWFVPTEQIGYYTAALKPIQILFVLPSLFAHVLFPVFSRKTDHKETKGILEKALAAIYLIAIPVMLGGWLMAKFLITLLYGNAYLPAVTPFRILIFIIGLNFPVTLLGYVILAHNKQAKTVGYSVGAVITNAILNYFLIAMWGIAGAGVATLISQSIAAFGYWTVAKTITGKLAIFSLLWRPLVASASMATIIIFMQYLGIPDTATLGIAVVVFSSVIILSRDPLLNETWSAFRYHTTR